MGLRRNFVAGGLLSVALASGINALDAFAAYSCTDPQFDGCSMDSRKCKIGVMCIDKLSLFSTERNTRR